jgi:hypothetical protein
VACIYRATKCPKTARAPPCTAEIQIFLASNSIPTPKIFFHTPKIDPQTPPPPGLSSQFRFFNKPTEPPKVSILLKIDDYNFILNF